MKTETKKNNLVYMEKICVNFGKTIALNNVSLTVGQGEVVGLLGNNGAGKTTLIKTLIGLVKPDSGKIFFQGKQVNFISPLQARLAGIETVFQDIALIDLLNVTRNFFLGRELTKKRGPFQFLNSIKMDSIVGKYLFENGIKNEHIIHKTANSLSGGERRKIAIGRANYFNAKLLILDEPTASLSEPDTEQVLKLVLKAKKRGTSVIFVTHNAQEVFEIADRFFILQGGKSLANLEKKDTDLNEIGKLLISSRISSVRQMAANVAHQIKNPLGVMELTAEMLRDDFEVIENKNNYYRLTHLLIKEIESLNLTLDNFLTFARPLKIKREVCSVHTIIKDAIRNIPMVNYSEVSVKIDVETLLNTVYLDKKLIEEVISNLLLNALEASRSNGLVKISVYSSDSSVIIEVKDNGEGFDEKKAKQIFSPFYTTKAKGTGLGLAIVNRIIEQHGGSISATSSTREGTIFSIKLLQAFIAINKNGTS